MRLRYIDHDFGIDNGSSYFHSDPWYYGSLFVRGHKYWNHRNDNFNGGNALIRDTCRDDTSPFPYHDDNPLDLTQCKTVPLRINGSFYKLRPDGSIDVEAVMTNWSMPSTDHWGDAWNACKPEHQYILSDDFRNQLTIDAVSNIIDTAEPDVDILNFLFELREFPRMLKDIGDTLVKGDFRAPDWHLAIEFGWKPLISDLKKLVDFQENVNRRLKYLEKLSKGKVRLRRKISEEKDVALSLPWETSEYVALLRHTRSYSRKSWYTAEVSSDRIPDLYADRVKLAKSLAYSTKLTPATVWNSIPWTWLIDWFTNIGEYIKIGNNRLDLRWSKLNIMTHQISSQQGEVVGISPTWGGYFNQYNATGSYSLSVESKTRYQANVLPFELLKFGFLTKRQFSILGSLALARKLKYHY